jgi:hypothetical protein
MSSIVEAPENEGWKIKRVFTKFNTSKSRPGRTVGCPTGLRSRLGRPELSAECVVPTEFDPRCRTDGSRWRLAPRRFFPTIGASDPLDLFRLGERPRKALRPIQKVHRQHCLAMAYFTNRLVAWRQVSRIEQGMWVRETRQNDGLKLRVMTI